ncbi:MAG: DNA translocase FtsK 4TM domain-containing protein [Planctomycetota bacterium]
MSEPRQIEFDVEAVLLSGLCIFLWISLVTYDPADPVGPLPSPLDSVVHIDAQVYPPNEEVQNACGWFGALASQMLIQALGAGSLLVVTGLTVLAVWMFRVQSNYVRASRQFGWLLIIVAFTTLVSLARIPLPGSPTIGSGGYLGALTATWLNDHFAILGSFILTLAVLVAGLLLSTDYVVMRTIGWLIWGSASVATSAAAATKKRVIIPAPEGGKRRTDVDDGVNLEGDAEDDLSIRIRGQKLSQSEDEAFIPEKSSGLVGVLGKVKNSILGPSQSAEDEAEAEEGFDHEEFVDGNYEEASNDHEEEDSEDAYEDDIDAEHRELESDNDTLQLRHDQPHVEPPAAPVKVKRKQRPKPEAQPDDPLAHLDDTVLPPGAEEYVLPGIDLLLESDDIDFEHQANEVRRKAKILEKTFKDFGFNVRVVEIETGPVIAQYEVELEAGLRLSKITGLADDLAIALRVPSVRIVAPIPGKNTVGIEVPNEARQVVRLREVIEEQGAKGKKFKIPLFLGKDVSGNPLTADLAALPHLLIAGRTGTGKSVCLNSIIASILMTRRPDEVRMLMIDPKMVELSGYGRLPHLMHPVVTDMRKAEAILAWAVDKMEERYTLLARAGVRHISSYNELGREELIDRLRPESAEEAEQIPDHLPFIVIVADEMADLMMTAGKEVEAHIIRLAQKSRAVGIHLILATQKPTVDVITGLIKSNLPARISFQVASRTDSRVVLDEMGADKLLGNGDMLFLWPGTSMLLRGQGTYMSDEEINAVVDHCSTGEQNFVNELVNLKVKEEEGEDVKPGALKKRDDLYAAAVDVVVREGRGSCSLLQRALGIGYGRAARLIDYMAEDGIVGQYNGSQAREVLLSVADWEAMHGESTEEPSAPASPPPPPRNKIRPHDPPAAGAGPRGGTATKVRVDQDEETMPWEDEEEAYEEDESSAEYEEESAQYESEDVEYEDEEDVEYEDADD